MSSAKDTTTTDMTTSKAFDRKSSENRKISSGVTLTTEIQDIPPKEEEDEDVDSKLSHAIYYPNQINASVS